MTNCWIQTSYYWRYFAKYPERRPTIQSKSSQKQTASAWPIGNPPETAWGAAQIVVISNFLLTWQHLRRQRVISWLVYRREIGIACRPGQKLNETIHWLVSILLKGEFSD